MLYFSGTIRPSEVKRAEEKLKVSFVFLNKVNSAETNVAFCC